jgi:hypothetical protein
MVPPSRCGGDLFCLRMTSPAIHGRYGRFLQETFAPARHAGAHADISSRVYTREEIAMLLMCYYEFNENMPAQERVKATQKVASAGAFPGKNVKLLRWDFAIDLWGVMLFEADSAADVERHLNVWRVAAPGVFKTTKTAPAMPVEELRQHAADLLKLVG